MSRIAFISAGMGAAVLLCAVGAASADPLPPISVRTFAGGEGASYTNVLAQTPSVSATVNPTDPFAVSEADSSIAYYFTVVGGPAQPVPMAINYTVEASQVPGTGSIDSSLADFELDNGTSYTDRITCNGSVCFSSLPNALLSQNNGFFTGSYDFFVTPGTITEVYIYAEGFAEGPGYASAAVDPVITIDPTFLAANPGYRLELDAGVGNGGVPEPASWALMVMGFGGLGAAMRASRRRRARAVA